MRKHNPEILSQDQNTYDKFYKDRDWTHKLGELRWQIKAYLKYISFERKTSISTILDVGCGTGDHCFLFDSMNFDVTGIDFSNTAISKANKKYNHLDFFESDATTINLSKKFDLFFVSGFSVFNTDDLSKPKQIITNWVSELENNGTILILSRSDLTGKKSAGGWFFHKEEEIRNMYDHSDFDLALYYAHPKLRYFVLLPLFPRLWAKIVHVLSKHVFAYTLKTPIRYMVILTKKT